MTMTPAGASVDAPAFRLGYRPALDGLRAVAVVLVMVHHTAAFLWPSLEPTFATGGFLGVDVFFVLSGFLITVILLDPRTGLGLAAGHSADRPGAAATARALGGFYLRRIRRLLPALCGVLLFLGGCSLVFHSPTGADYRATLAWVLTYTGNLGVLSTHRIAPEVAHTWSLAIEGQFYVVWPIVALVALRLARGRRSALAAVAVAGIVAVVIWRGLAWGFDHNWLAIYLRTPARADDLLVGCLAGLAVSAGWIRGVATAFWRVALVGGVVVVVVLSFTVEGSTGALYEGGLTAIAVVAALMLLGALFAGPTFPATRLLASRPFTMVGRWSYSLYLWHFPLFYLLHLHQPGWNPALRTAVGWALAFALAIASYTFVEQPFLRGRGRPAA